MKPLLGTVGDRVAKRPLSLGRDPFISCGPIAPTGLLMLSSTLHTSASNHRCYISLLPPFIMFSSRLDCSAFISPSAFIPSPLSFSLSFQSFLTIQTVFQNEVDLRIARSGSSS